MSRKEVERYTVINRVLEGDSSQALAAQQLGLSVRQIKRLCRTVRERGSSALISKRRGKPSKRSIRDECKGAIMVLVHQHYADFGPALACGYLARVHQQVIGVESLRGGLIKAGPWKAMRLATAMMECGSRRVIRCGMVSGDSA